MPLTSTILAGGLGRIVAHMGTVADELNTLDGQLGDGDLGSTMTRAGRALREVLPILPEDIGLALFACAQAMTEVSGSSYGMLLATGLMAAAKPTRGRTEVPWAQLGTLLRTAQLAISARGRTRLGDKTLLDALDAAAEAVDGRAAPREMLQTAAAAVDATIQRMRGMPARTGRARIFGDRSIGLDDPGMRAFREVLRGLGA